MLCPFVDGAKAKIFRCCRQNTSFLDHGKGEGDKRDVRNGDVAKNSNALNIREFSPMVFYMGIQIPQF